MREVYAITGLEQIPATERWLRFVEPLARKLADSGLGEIVDLSVLRDRSDSGVLDVEEVAVRLNNYEYGKDLLDRHVRAAGISSCPARQPVRWRDYNCDDYYNSDYSSTGYWHEPSQYWYIVPFDRVCEDDENEFLIVGGSGFDGIRWGYRKHASGFWAFPVDGEFVQMASDFCSFMPGFISGSIRTY